MAIIKKIVLVRIADMTEEIAADFLAQFAELMPANAEPLPVLPVVWNSECDPSHEAFVLAGFQRKHLKTLTEWENAHSFSTVLDLEGEKFKCTTEEALASVGLRLHPLT